MSEPREMHLTVVSIRYLIRYCISQSISTQFAPSNDSDWQIRFFSYLRVSRLGLCVSPRAQMVILMCSIAAEVDCKELTVQMMPKSSAVY